MLEAFQEGFQAVNTAFSDQVTLPSLFMVSGGLAWVPDLNSMREKQSSEAFRMTVLLASKLSLKFGPDL